MERPLKKILIAGVLWGAICAVIMTVINIPDIVGRFLYYGFGFWLSDYMFAGTGETTIIASLLFAMVVSVLFATAYSFLLYKLYRLHKNSKHALIVRVCLWLYALIPLITSFVFVVYSLLLKSQLGRWPIPMQDNVPDSLWGIDHFFSSTLLLLLCSVLGAIIGLLFLFSTSFKSTYLQCISVYVFGILLLLLLVFATPLGVVLTWFLD